MCCCCRRWQFRRRQWFGMWIAVSTTLVSVVIGWRRQRYRVSCNNCNMAPPSSLPSPESHNPKILEAENSPFKLSCDYSTVDQLTLTALGSRIQVIYLLCSMSVEIFLLLAPQNWVRITLRSSRKCLDKSCNVYLQLLSLPLDGDSVFRPNILRQGAVLVLTLIN